MRWRWYNRNVKRLVAILIVLGSAGYYGWSSGMLDRYLPRSSGAAEPVSCAYAGQSYAQGRQRMAEDGCNVCACGETGWSCTAYACQAAGTGFGRIVGPVTFPEGASAVRVCAVNQRNGKERCTHATPELGRFLLPVPAGAYRVYAAPSDRERPFAAWYDEYVRCGRGEGCKDRTPIVLEVAEDAEVEADPSDWDAESAMDLINVTPSKYEYSTHNYYDGAKFHVKTRGMTSVTLFYTPYPPVEDPVPIAIGQASDLTEADGIQTWKLAVPPGLEAMTVYAEGTDAHGYVIRSPVLRVVRPAMMEGSSIE